MYEIWTQGQLPYIGRTNQQVWTDVLSGDRLSCPNDCPDSVWAVIMDTWHEDPRKRPTFAMMCTRLETLRQHEVAVSRPSNTFSFPALRNTDSILSRSGHTSHPSGKPNSNSNSGASLAKQASLALSTNSLAMNGSIVTRQTTTGSSHSGSDNSIMTPKPVPKADPPASDPMTEDAYINPLTAAEQSNLQSSSSPNL